MQRTAPAAGWCPRAAQPEHREGWPTAGRRRPPGGAGPHDGIWFAGESNVHGAIRTIAAVRSTWPIDDAGQIGAQ
jgi:hypothetical protein